MVMIVASASLSFAQDKPLPERIKAAGLAEKQFSLIVSTKVKKDKLDEFLKMAMKAETATRKEKGCVVYTFQQDVEDPTLVTLLETWKDLKALETHMTEEHTKELLSSFGKLLDGPVTLKLTAELKK